MDVLTGFAGLSEEDKVTVLTAHFKRHRLSNFNVHLTLPGTCGVTRDLEFPAAVATGDALRSAVGLQVENLSPWASDEIYWDCVWEPPAKGARTVLVHVGIVPRSVLEPWIGLFRSARLALTGASLSSLSWAHGVSVFWGTQRPSMVLAAETDYVEGVLIRDGRLYAVNMPGGDPAQVVPASASQLMRAARIESMDQVRLVAHGTAGTDAGLESVRLPVEGSSITANTFGAISTALLGLARSGFRLNVIPAHLRHQRNYLQLVPTYALIVMLLLLGAVLWIREPYQQLVFADRLQSEIQWLAPAVRSVADEEAQLNRHLQRLRELDGVIRGRDSNLEALRELTRILPPDTWLTSYQYQDKTVTISGASDSAAAVQKLIEDSALFRDAQFTSSITRDAFNKDRFIIRATLEAQR
jgi:Tfp pilus assembly protein PilN